MYICSLLRTASVHYPCTPTLAHAKISYAFNVYQRFSRRGEFFGYKYQIHIHRLSALISKKNLGRSFDSLKLPPLALLTAEQMRGILSTRGH